MLLGIERADELAGHPAVAARRVVTSISKLNGSKRRPCCFNLASCTDPEVARSGKLVMDRAGD